MFEDIKRLIDKANKIAVFTHTHPDGDALGSSYALKLALCGIGKECEVFLEEECCTKEYSLIMGKEDSGLKIEDCDLKIALDCSDAARLGALGGKFIGNVAAIDHHVAHGEFCECMARDSEAAATGQLVYELLTDMDIPISREIAHNLYIAISSDTGSFKYSSTSPRTMEIAARLMETGIDFAGIAKALYDTKSREYLNMYKTAIDKMEFYAGGKIALLALMNSDFENAGLDESLASAIVTLPSGIEGVIVGVYIRERGEGFKVSLRSNCDIDVSEIAAGFGGGGHIRASGYSSDAPLDSVKSAIVGSIEKYL